MGLLGWYDNTIANGLLVIFTGSRSADNLNLSRNGWEVMRCLGRRNIQGLFDAVGSEYNNTMEDDCFQLIYSTLIRWRNKSCKRG
jgi:hypothetical protein